MEKEVTIKKVKNKKVERIKRKKRGRPFRYTIEEVTKALIASAGYITVAADKLNCEYHTVQRYIETNTVLQETMKHIHEKELDFSEAMLKKKIKDGDTACLLFHLKCKGKKRGYIERQEITGASGEPLQIEIIEHK